MVEHGEYDLRPLIDLAGEARTGHIRSPQQLFERVAITCVEHLPY